MDNDPPLSLEGESENRNVSRTSLGNLFGLQTSTVSEMNLTDSHNPDTPTTYVLVSVPLDFEPDGAATVYSSQIANEGENFCFDTSKLGSDQIIRCVFVWNGGWGAV